MCVSNEKIKRSVWWTGIAKTKTHKRKSWKNQAVLGEQVIHYWEVRHKREEPKLNVTWLTVIPGLHIHITSYPAAELAVMALGTCGACLEGRRRELLSCRKRQSLTSPLCLVKSSIPSALVPPGRKLFKAHPWCPQRDTVRFPVHTQKEFVPKGNPPPLNH